MQLSPNNGTFRCVFTGPTVAAVYMSSVSSILSLTSDRVCHRYSIFLKGVPDYSSNMNAL